MARAWLGLLLLVVVAAAAVDVECVGFMLQKQSRPLIKSLN